MRAGAQADELRPQVDRPVVAIAGDVVEGDVDGHGVLRSGQAASAIGARKSWPDAVAQQVDAFHEVGRPTFMQAVGQDVVDAGIARLRAWSCPALRWVSADWPLATSSRFLTTPCMQNSSERGMSRLRISSSATRSGVMTSRYRLAIDLETRHRAEQGAPLVEVGGALVLVGRGEAVVLHVNAGGVVGAFEQGGQADEVVGLVLQQGAHRDAA